MSAEDRREKTAGTSEEPGKIWQERQVLASSGAAVEQGWCSKLVCMYDGGRILGRLVKGLAT